MADFKLNYTGTDVQNKLGAIKTESEIQSMIDSAVSMVNSTISTQIATRSPFDGTGAYGNWDIRLKKSTLSWSDNTTGLRWTRTENASSATNYDFLVTMQDGNRGACLAIDWRSGSSNVYFNAKHDDTGANKWLGWAKFTTAAHSSILRKENVQDLSAQEAKKILNLHTVSFDYKEGLGPKNQYGFIAEEVKDVLPYMIADTGNLDEASLQLEFHKIIPHIVKLLQIQDEEIQLLKSKIAKIEGGGGDIISYQPA